MMADRRKTATAGNSCPGMREVLAFSVGFAGLVAVLALALRGARLKTGPARHWGELRRYSDPVDGPGFIAGLLGALSVASVLTAWSAQSSIGASEGAVVGLVAAGLGVAGAVGRTAFRVLFGATGAMAAVIGLLAFFAGGPCATGSAAVRVMAAVLLVLCGGLGAILSLGRRRRSLPRGLTWFAAVELLVFLAAPLGVLSFTFSAWPLAALTMAIATIAGFAATLAPTVVVRLAAIAVAFSSALTGAVGLTCSGVDPGVPAMVLGFSVVFLLVRGCLRLLGLR